MLKLNDHASLLACMREGAVVITPQPQLSQHLISDFMKAGGYLVEEKPACFPYTTFLELLFKKLMHSSPQKVHPAMLTKQQTSHLWRKLLSSHPEYLVHDALLKEMQGAWKICHIQQIDLHHEAFSATTQTRQFQKLAFELQEKLTSLFAIAKEQLPAYLLSQKTKIVCQPIVWAGFDTYTPEQQSFQKHLQSENCKLYHYDLMDTKGICHTFAAKDEAHESEQLIYWLKNCLSKDKQNIGHCCVIVPELEKHHLHLKRLLQKEMPDESVNISVRENLLNHPLINHALAWINLEIDSLSFKELRLFLSSPYLASSKDEMLARAEFMERSPILQEFKVEKWRAQELLKVTCPKLSEALERLTSYPEETSVKNWILEFKMRLIHLGFPGEYALNTDTQLAYEQLMSLFDAFLELSLLGKNMSKNEAISTFGALLESNFLQKQQQNARINILSLAQISECNVQNLWVMGLTSQYLPENFHSNAFIPLILQKSFCNVASSLKHAKKLLRRVQANNKNIVFSYPCTSGDNHNMPNTLIAQIPAFKPAVIPIVILPSQVVNFNEAYQLPLTNHEKIAGGTSILANQSKCPFRAFAAHRLHAKAITWPNHSPSAQERGQLIHKVMEILWKNIQKQQTLLNLTSKQLNQYIEEAIQQSLQELIQRRPGSFTNLIEDVERIRLRRQVNVCIDWERTRTNFEIESVEQIFTIRLANMNFNIRVDRIDKLETGSKWVIDYKSQLPQIMPWNEERPQEPQLLIYALLDEAIDGLLFVQLKDGRLTCKGLSKDKQPGSYLLPLKSTESFAQYRQNWQSQLNALAEEFSSGHCPPKPIKPSTCQLCPYPNLCRIGS